VERALRQDHHLQADDLWFKYCHTRDGDRAQVYRTVVHEIAHHFGIDDPRLESRHTARRLPPSAGSAAVAERLAKRRWIVKQPPVYLGIGG